MNLTLKLPNNVDKILNMLNNAGYEAFAVGGCVRDAMLGIEPNDWDITTSAQPAEIKEVFSSCRTIDIGEAHGTIGVLIDDVVYEITTYRIDGDYADKRHPDSV